MRPATLRCIALLLATIPTACARHSGAATTTATPQPPNGQPNGGAPSSNALLADLTMSAATLDGAFDPLTAAYTAQAPFSATATTLTPTAQHPGATIEVNGAAVASGQPSASTPMGLGTTRFETVVTAEDGITMRTYLVDITRRAPGGGGIEYIKPDLPGAGDVFGRAVSVSGDTLVVGAPVEASCGTGTSADPLDNSCPGSGAVYVFVRDPINGWTQQAYLKPSNTATGDRFGTSVALVGDTLVVGAPREDSCTALDPTNNSCLNSGAVYVFQRAGTAWAQTAYIKAPHPDADDEFGTTLAFDGAIIAVGAPYEDGAGTGIGADPTNNNAPDSGAVFLHSSDGSGNWPLVAYLKASNTDAGDNFGYSLDLSADRLIVGAPLESSSPTAGPSDNSRTGAGAAYLFAGGKGSLAQVAFLKGHNAGFFDRFGYRVAVDGELAVVAAPFEDSSDVLVGGSGADNDTQDSGALYVFAGELGWTQSAFIKALNPDPDDCIGIGLDLEGGMLLAGAPKEASSAIGLDGDSSDNSVPSAGAAYLYESAGGLWSFRHYIKASNTDAGDQFGTACRLRDGVLFVGGPNEASDGTSPADNSAPQAGAVYAYR